MTEKIGYGAHLVFQNEAKFMVGMFLLAINIICDVLLSLVPSLWASGK